MFAGECTAPPTALSKTDNLDLLDSLAHAIGQRAPARTELSYKVRAHIGCEGNELADAGAKRVASGDTEDIEVVSAQTTHNPDNRTTNPFTMANGERINKPKSQLRQVITDWMTVKDKPAQQKVQASMSHVAAAHLNRIVPQYRRLCAYNKVWCLTKRESYLEFKDIQVP